MKSVRIPLAVGLVAAALTVSACTAPRLAPTLAPEATAAAVATPAPPRQATNAPEATVAPLLPTRAMKEATATPTTNLSAAAHLERGNALQQDGSYEAAGVEYRAALQGNPPPEVARQALLRLGHSQLSAAAYQGAADALARFAATYPDDPEVPTALFWLGQALAGQGEGQTAAVAYRRYLEQRPLLASYVQEKIGDALTQAEDHAGAAAAYRAAADDEPAASRKAHLLEALASSQRALQSYDAAVGTYDEILKMAQIASYRAQIMFEAGTTLRDAGNRAGAAERWNVLVATYPETAYAAQALTALDGWGLARADALTRGRVEYGAGRYAAALDILHRYILGDDTHTGDAHYYAALCYRKLGQHAQSVRELDLLIDTHPLNTLVVEAWYEKGQSLALAGQTDQAVAIFRRLAAGYPQQARAVDALWRMAQLYSEGGRAAEASAAYVQLITTYPASGYAAEARFQAGFVYYLANQPQAAAKAWTGLVSQEDNATMRARLLLWLGKAGEKQGDAASARERWAQAAAASPSGFWGLRARDLLAGRRFLGQAPEGAFAEARYTARGSPEEAEAWLVGWAGAAPGGQPVSMLPPALTEQEAFQRGIEFWKLDDSPSAYAQLRGVETTYKDDARALYALSLYARDQGLYPLSLRTAQRVLDLAPAQARQSPPRLIQELIYPTYYVHLVLQEAQPTNTDPLLFLSLMRQESAFDRDATSYADARGLTQVIPSTGKYISEQLKDTSYASERLWRPATSLRYGMWYFSRALQMFDDDALMALVGYNAGPGNAAAWGKLANGDQDLYYERVSNAQPRAYMQKIYENRVRYEELYGR